MDLGTVKRKLNHNVYNNIQEFIYDIKLVFDNCVKYNGKENQIAKFAIEIKNLFVKLNLLLLNLFLYQMKGRRKSKVLVLPCH